MNTIQQPVSLIYTDGSLGIMYFILDDGYAKQECTPDNVERELTKSAVDAIKGPVKSWRLISLEDIPKDRVYRNAWKDGGDKIDHNITKAKEIHKEYMRIARAEVLLALDIEYIRADEQKDNNKKSEIAATKQALRDVTTHPDIAIANTVEELKQVWPTILGPKVF